MVSLNAVIEWLRPWEPSAPVIIVCAAAISLYAIGMMRGAKPGFWPALAFFFGYGADVCGNPNPV